MRTFALFASNTRQTRTRTRTRTGAPPCCGSQLVHNRIKCTRSSFVILRVQPEGARDVAPTQNLVHNRIHRVARFHGERCQSDILCHIL